MPYQGAQKFDEIGNVAKISIVELNYTLQRLENREMGILTEKKGFLGTKKELNTEETIRAMT